MEITIQIFHRISMGILDCSSIIIIFCSHNQNQAIHQAWASKSDCNPTFPGPLMLKAVRGRSTCFVLMHPFILALIAGK